MFRRLASLVLALGLAAPVAQARAQDAAGQAPAAGTVGSATDASAAGAAAICTDRPGKVYATCTAEPGTFQVESDIVNGSFLRLHGVTTDVWLVTDPTLKYGVNKTLDVEVSIAPYQFVRTRAASGAGETLGGVGDLYLRAKYAAYASADGRLAVSLAPYVKAPTARLGVGDGGWEGGSAVVIGYELDDQLTLALSPEVDAYRDSEGDGRHVNHVEVVSLAYALPRSVTVAGELWGDWNYDPAGEIDQYSADVSVAWGVTKALQLDGGLNFGLNRYTPGVQAYVGVSTRF